MTDSKVDSRSVAQVLGDSLRKKAFRPIRILVISMAALGALLALGIGALERLALKSHSQAAAMLDNALPSTEILTDTAAALGHLDTELDQAMNALVERQEVDWREIRFSRHKMLASFENYRRFAAYPGEERLRTRIDAAMANGEVVLSSIETTVDRGDFAGAAKMENDDWRNASDAIDSEVRNLLLFNIQQATEHARALQDLWGDLSDVSLGLGFALLLLGAAATWVAASAVARQVSYELARSSELEMFAGRVAHDILSPLASAQMALQVLVRMKEPRTEATAERGLASLRRTQHIVDGLFDFATAGGVPARGRRASVPMAVAAVLAELGPEAQAASIALDAPPPPGCEVACSSEILSVVLMNLVRNAIKFMGNAAERHVEITAAPQGPRVRFEVADTGPGLPAGFEEQAFRAYLRGRDDVPGLGLGLATVKRLIEAYGGQVGVHSATGQGATFWFTLPLADPPPGVPGSRGPGRRQELTHGSQAT